MKTRFLAAALLLSGSALFLNASRADDLDKPIPAPLSDPASTAASETAVLAGGCFWGQQGVFEHVKGVTKVLAGYSGGAKATAFYPIVGSETTGHAESVQITFDPKQVSFGTLLRIYFSVAHDPTQLNAQGPDSGPSYRSEIFAAAPAQEAVAKAYIAQLGAAHVFARPIVTRVEPLKGFYDAEAYHQDYLALNPHDSYIMANDLPKIAALARVWPQYYRADAVRLASR
jgi:peptide-methionine (S)-S-oxide reductase